MEKILIELQDDIIIEADASTLPKPQGTANDGLELVSAATEAAFNKQPVKLPKPFGDLIKKTLANIGNSVKEAMEEVSNDTNLASEAKIELGLKLSAQGKIYIVNIDGDATLKISMTIKHNN